MPAIPEHPQPEGRAAAIYVAVSKLTRWAENPRENDESVDEVVESIKAFGFGAPLLARIDTGELIAGDTRIQAAMRLGLVEVPVRYMTLDELRGHAHALVDNKLNEGADWKKRERDELLRALAAEDAPLPGFDEDDMARALREPEETTVQAYDVSAVQDEFWMSVRGPLPKQPAALAALRKAFEAIEGVSVDMGTVE